MAEDKDIFIGYASSLKDLAQELADLLGMRLEFIPDETDHGFDRYEVLTEGLDAILTSASGFTNDRDMRFEDYQYYVSVRASGRAATSEDPARLENERDNFSLLVFETLKATGRFPLLLVHNMQVKLSQFSPASMPSLSQVR